MDGDLGFPAKSLQPNPLIVEMVRIVKLEPKEEGTTSWAGPKYLSFKNCLKR